MIIRGGRCQNPLCSKGERKERHVHSYNHEAVGGRLKTGSTGSTRRASGSCPQITALRSTGKAFLAFIKPASCWKQTGASVGIDPYHIWQNPRNAKRENETMKKTILFTLMFALGSVFLAPAPASANNGPSESSMVAELLMFLVLIALTAAGGGYAVMNKMKPRRRWTGLGYAILAIIAFIFSVAHGDVMFLVVLIVTIYGIQRGVKMIMWGIQARSGKQRPDYVAEANPWRLITAGAALIVLMVILAAVAVMMIGMSDDSLKRARAAALNYEAKKAYSYLAAYETGNPKATGAVTCNDLQKLGFTLSSYNSCSSDVMIKSGKVVSGSIRITWTTEPGFLTPRISKPEAVITYKGELTEAKP